MTPEKRLRRWADNIQNYGSDISRWGGLHFVIPELRRIADYLAAQEARIKELETEKAEIRERALWLVSSGDCEQHKAALQSMSVADLCALYPKSCRWCAAALQQWAEEARELLLHWTDVVDDDEDDPIHVEMGRRVHHFLTRPLPGEEPQS